MGNRNFEPGTAAFAEAGRDAAPLDWSIAALPETRARIIASQQKCYWEPAAIPIHTEMTQLPGPDGSLTVSIKTPRDADRSGPVALFLHGGGWVCGALETHAPFVDRLVAASGATIVSLDYSLSPEQKFPVALHECHAALRWIEQRYRQPPVVIGDSAGGNLAAALCILCRDAGPEICQQVLICPLIDAANDTWPSRQAFGKGGLIVTNDELAIMTGYYAADEADIANPLFTPLHVESAAGLPPAMIISAEFDPLRDEGKAFADKLAAAGVDVTYSMYPGTMHDFPVFGDAIPISADAIQQIADFLQLAKGSKAS